MFRNTTMATSPNSTNKERKGSRGIIFIDLPRYNSLETTDRDRRSEGRPVEICKISKIRHAITFRPRLTIYIWPFYATSIICNKRFIAISCSSSCCYNCNNNFNNDNNNKTIPFNPSKYFIISFFFLFKIDMNNFTTVTYVL